MRFCWGADAYPFPFRAVDVVPQGGGMQWTKPEFKEVAVTLEVTAYVAQR